MKINIIALVEQAKKNNTRAQTILLNLYWNDVYRYVLNKSKHENDAEDITLSTFTKAFSKLKLYNPDFDFRTWLISIAHNTTIDFFRKKKIVFNSDLHLMVNLTDQNISAEEDLINKQQKAEIVTYLMRLKPNYRRVIELRYFDEKTYKEISEELHLSVSNVKILLLRAKKLLSELIQKNDY